MDKLNRIYKLHKLFRSHRMPLSLTAIQTRLECSERTARRSIAELRDDLNAPIQYDRDRNGFHYAGSDCDIFELPGIWFSPSELHALLTSYRLLDNLQPGLFEPYINPIRNRLHALLQHLDASHTDFDQRVRILQMAARPCDLDIFRTIATATLTRKQLRVLYHGRARDTTTERTVSPLRLVHYRSNWYLDTWCHLRNDFRHFSLDRVQPIEITDQPAQEFADEELDRHFASAYGIFAGELKAIATLRFTPTAAKWVADEQWHPEQEGRVLDDGGYELKIPYNRPEELVMDILKYGPEVEVVGPMALRKQIAQTLIAAAAIYQ